MIDVETNFASTVLASSVFCRNKLKFPEDLSPRTYRIFMLS